MEKIIARFENKFDKGKGCWLWKPKISSEGYGIFFYTESFKVSKIVKAHRFSYETYKGKIPKGMVIDHICRNRSCVNPCHLRIVTPRTNTLENSDSLASKNKRKTHCMRGHKFDKYNSSVWKSTRKGHAPFRVCLVCDRLRRSSL